MREKNIVRDLMDSKAYCSLDYLAQRYQVSARTISNDIKYLTQVSKKNGFEILLKRKEGYYLKIVDKEKLLDFLQDEDIQTSPIKDRILVILTRLLSQPSYQKQDDLADDLQISRSMIKLDMNKVEERLAQYELCLNRKAHFGICVEGDYHNRKTLLMDLMDQDDYVEEKIDELIDKEKMKLIDKKLIELLRTYDLSTNYAEMMKLDRYLKITIALCKNGFVNDEQVSLNNSQYIDIAMSLKEEIERISSLDINRGEVADIAEYLRMKTKPKTVTLNYDDELKEDILKFLEEADAQYETAFLKDRDFIQSLFAHVSLLVDRLHQSISFDNPLVQEISAKYPEIFNISIKFANMLESRYKVKATQDEIGFIATHFAAHMEKEYRNKLRSFNKIAIVCSSGGGSAFLIKLKIESLFSDADVATFSFMEMEDLHRYSPDIIFTIKELQDSFNVPVVLIKELLNDEDIQKIKHMFEFCGIERKKELKLDTFHSLFHKDAFWMLDEGSYKEIIKTMSSSLVLNGYAQAGYSEYVLQREDVLSTVYSNGIAIPHPIEMCSDHNMLAVGIVKHDLKEENKVVKVIFLVNLQKGNLEIHQNISRVLFEVMQDERLVDKIRNSSSYEDFMKNISKLDF
ncbi:MAG: BglG family transcription antiterminator [Longicatena sp.]